jgi:thiosulfate/3-mercaptopyruvate sulfurtransferase
MLLLSVTNDCALPLKLSTQFGQRRDVASKPAGAADGSRDIVSRCRLSHRATLCDFAMTELLGWRNVRSYDGSWTEWGSLVGAPIEK